MQRLSWLMALLFVPIASAQVLLLEDAPGDVNAYAYGTATPLAGPASDAPDMLSLSVLESEEAFTFTIAVLGFDQPETVLNYEIRFSHGLEAYLVDMYGIIATGSDELTGVLLRETSTGHDRLVEIPVTIDRTQAQVVVDVPRHHITDEAGAVPRIGRPITDIHVLARGSETPYVGQDGVFAWRDLMPDAGEGASYTSTFGLAQDGDARLTSDEPTRFSNGEATTFLYEVLGHNDGGEAQTFSLVADEVPEGWDVYFPIPRFDIEAGASQPLPVVVQTPFMHRHGEETPFRVEMQGPEGHVGRVLLGVRYPDIPQPSGHHSKLFLHSRAVSQDPFDVARYALSEAATGSGTQALAYMNTLEEDPLDGRLEVEAPWCGTKWGDAPDPVPVGGEAVPEGAVYCWLIPLSPTLRVGLDGDMAAIGRVEVPVHSAVPAERAWLGGHVIYFPPDATVPERIERSGGLPPEGAVVLATLHPEAEVAFAAESTHPLAANVTPLPSGDLVPYERGGSLWLWLNMTQARPETVIGPKADKPGIMPGGTVELPLLDYADPINEVIGAADVVRMSAKNQSLRVNPGETAVFEVEVQNRLDIAASFDLRLIGGRQDWARIVGKDALRIGSMETALVQVAVTPPVDAVDGERADLVLEAAAGADGTARGLMRLVAEVDVDADHVDRAAALADSSEGKASPSLSVAVLFIAMAGLAWTRRPRS